MVGDEILAWKKAAREMPLEERTNCPNDDCPLKKTKDGILHCEFDGWTSRPRIRIRRY